ncbi:protein translocase SEC6 [Amanita rubescens]|nr:protein translocase SEC6 [Amanita rubescens]
MSEKLREFMEVPQQFVRDGNQFVTRCTKPSQKEFLQICRAVAVGFAVIGFIGYFVKLIPHPNKQYPRRRCLIAAFTYFIVVCC